MVDLLGPDECRSCGACWKVCPVGAVEVYELRGFHYPRIDSSRCVGCGRCERACEVRLESLHEVWGVKNANFAERRMETSGGVFLLLADDYLSDGGAVYGARDERGRTGMARAITRDETLSLCGSKYVYCPVGNTYEQVRKDLDSGLRVLYTGTSCQINGLNRYLEIMGTHRDKLLTVDFFCHGTPSPDIYCSYLDWVERKTGRRIRALQHRRTEGCWDQPGEAYRPILFFEDGAHDGCTVLSQLWIRLFFSNLCLKEGCYHCKFASTESPADLTMGDFWGLQDINPSFSDADGVSLLKINSETGRCAFERAKEHAEVIKVPEDQALARQVNAFRPTAMPVARDEFWADYDALEFKELVAKWCNYTIWHRLKWRVKRMLVEHGLWHR